MTIYRTDADRYRPSVQRRDRRWEIQAGSRRFAIVFSEHSASAPVASFQVLRRVGEGRRAGMSVSRVIGAVLAVFAGVATIGIALQADGARAGVGSYVVSVPVPQRVGMAVASVPAKPVWRAPIQRSASLRPAIATGSAGTVATNEAAQIVSIDPPTGLSTRQGAMAAALRTGVFQQWARADGDERGFVVAGPASNGCRDLSVLIRRFGDDDKVEKLRQCGAVGGD